MTESRQNHASKNLAERQDYWEKVINASSGPTAEDTTVGIDSTDQPAPGEKTQPKASPSTETGIPSWLTKLWQSYRTKLLLYVAIALLGWTLFQLYTLNREVGELKIKVERIDKLEQRIDRFIDKKK
jgi:hypothetical protein